MTEFVELRELLLAVRRRWYLPLITMTLIGFLGFLYSVGQAKVYSATGTMIVGRSLQATQLNRSDIELGQDLALTYANLARRQPILQGVVDSLGLDESWTILQRRVRVGPVADTQLLEVRAEDTNPETAQAIADSLMAELIELSRSALGNPLATGSEAFIQQRLANLQVSIEEGQGQLETLERSIAAGEYADTAELERIQSEINVLEGLLADWDSTYAQLLLLSDRSLSSNYLAVIEPARTDPDPVRPRIPLNTAIAAALGLILGLGLTFLWDRLDDRIGSSQELSQVLNVPDLGIIRQTRFRKPAEGLVTNQASLAEMESYRLLRSKLQYLAQHHARKLILITSPGEDTGRSLLVANLGILMTQVGLRTIIVDANVKDPKQHLLFQLPQRGGLADALLMPGVEADELLKPGPVAQLQILTSGASVSNSAEMLDSLQTHPLFGCLAERADIVLCDGSPSLEFADAAVLASQVDGVVVVVNGRRTARSATKQAIRDLQQVGAEILGVVQTESIG